MGRYEFCSDWGKILPWVAVLECVPRPGDPPLGKAAGRWRGREIVNRPLPLVAQGAKAAKGNCLQRG